MAIEKYDVLIVTTAKDFLRLQSNYPRLVRYMQGRNLIFVGSKEVGELVQKAGMGERVTYLNEDEILPFDEVHKVMKCALQCDELARGVTGWYYQQFLKMKYSFLCEDDYYLMWDGDTIPCKPFSMFSDESGQPYLDLKREYHEEYFNTLSKLFPGMHKVIEQSFISEHMLMKCDIMQKLIRDIEGNKNLKGNTFYEKIIYAIDSDKLKSNSFSEFETYGTYVAFRYPDAYKLREWHSFRYGASFFDAEEITDSDYKWLGKDFDAISFEKNQSVREDHKDAFTKKEYQEKLSARQILEIVQGTFKEGYMEVWDDSEKKYETYEKLGDAYLGANKKQAFLCYENAEFLCKDEAHKKVITVKKESLLKQGVHVPKASIVIVSYNCQYMMEKCIESIRQNCAPDSYEMVVLDNASTDGVTEWLKEQEDINLLLSDENMGFPAGCNVGVQYAGPENDIFFLNNDTRMAPNALFWLRMGLYANDKIGATGCVANYCGNDQQIDVEFSLPNQYLEWAEENVNVPMDEPYEERNRLCGFAMLIKRTVLNQVGGMDENLSPGYLDDDDLSVRIRMAGYQLYICHNSFIYHAGSQSFCNRSDVEEIYKRNYFYLLNKWGYDIPTYSMANLEAVSEIKCDSQKEIRVLEIGAGSGSTLARIKFLYPNAEVYGVEECEKAALYGAESIPIYVGKIENVVEKLPMDFFDYIICTKRKPEDDFSNITELVSELLKENGKIL